MIIINGCLVGKNANGLLNQIKSFTWTREKNTVQQTPISVFPCINFLWPQSKYDINNNYFQHIAFAMISCLVCLKFLIL